MNDNNPKISKAAQYVRDLALEPYNPDKPTFSDRATRFISELTSPNLSEEARRADVNRLKPWFKGSWSFFSLMDGHPLMALLPWAPAMLKRRMAKETHPAEPAKFLAFAAVFMLCFGALALMAALFGG